MAITSSSLGNIPAAVPLSGPARMNALLLTVVNQIQNVAGDWAKITQLPIQFDPPTAQNAASPGMLDSLPWPLHVTQILTSGELNGKSWVFIQVRDAVAATAGLMERPIPSPTDPVTVDAEALDAIHELFNIYVGASDRVMSKGADERIHLKQEWTRQIATTADWIKEAGTGVGIDGSLIEIRMKIGTYAFRFWQLVPNALGSDIVEYFREELSQQISIVCGGHAEPPAKAGWRGKILVADPADSIRAVVREHLEKEGWSIIQAESGDHAVRIARSTPLKAILLEVGFRDGDGFEVCRKLRQTSDKSHLPIIFCTSLCGREDVLKAVQAGASDFLMKPFTRETLVNKVRQATQAAEKAAEPAKK